MGRVNRKRALENMQNVSDSEHSAFAQSIIRIFFSPILHSIASNEFLEDSDGHDQTAQMRRLIRAFAARICPKPHFRMVQPINTSAYNNSACE